MIQRDHIPLHISRIGLLMIGVLAATTPLAWSQKVVDRSSESTVREAPLQHMQAVGVTRAEQNPLPGDAQELIAGFEQQEAQARAEMDKQVAAVREQLVAHLRELQDRYAKAGQLDEAVAIRDQIRQMTGQRMPMPPGSFVPQIMRPIPDPGNATQWRGQVNTQILIRVTGSTDGWVWGHGIYSDDSTIAAAAVHAGILQPGETGVIRLTILPAQDQYVGTASNGVTSSDYGPWPGSYTLGRAARPRIYRNLRQPNNAAPWLEDEGSAPRLRDQIDSTSPHAPFDGTVRIERAPATTPSPGYNPLGSGQPATPQDYIVTDRVQAYGLAPGWRRPEPGSGPPPMDALRDDAAAAAKAGHPLVLERLVTGMTTSGTVWGTDVYTDDSSIEAAAVHAGVLRDREQGWVRITLMPDIGKYPGSTRNGVTSQDWGMWGGCFRIERGGSPPAAPGVDIAPGGGGPYTPELLPPPTDGSGAPGLVPSVPGAIPIRPELTPPATVEPRSPGALPPNSGPPSGAPVPPADEPRSSGPAPSVPGGLPGASAPPAAEEK